MGGEEGASVPWGGFVRVWLIVALLALAAGAAVSVTVDPYWVFRDRPPWLAWTAGANRHLDLEMRRVKPLQLFGRPAETVLIGSSVVYRGLDPADVAGQGYNFGLSSLMADELPAVAELAAARGARHVALGLDYFMFTSMPGPPRIGDGLASSLRRVEAYLQAALSLRALAGSRPSVIRDVTEGGFWRADGFKTTPDYAPDALRRIVAGQEADALAYRPETLRHLAAALEALKNHDVRLYLSPVSSAQLAILATAGRSAEWDAWRADVTALAARAGVRLHDLARTHPYAVFDPSGGSSTSWFDPLHFKPPVGSWVLRQIGLARA